VDIGGFDLNLLKAFDALYAERHVTGAGLRIGLSQSAMSGTLSRLRELFEDELFVRTPSGMQPTPRADDFAGPVSDALRLVRGVLHSGGFDPASADHAFTIAMTDYAAFVLLPPLLARLSVEASRIDVRVCGMFGRSEAVELLDSGEANLAIGFPVEASARILMRPLLEEGFCARCLKKALRASRGVGTPHLRMAPALRPSRPRRISWYLPRATARGLSTISLPRWGSNGAWC
jgi:DNA-binding transcriptional LysR family regulator